MLQKALLITFSLSLAGCATLPGGAPAKPSVTLGVIDFPSGEVIENDTNGRRVREIDTFEKAKAAKLRAAIVFDGARVPLASYDKAIAFKPDPWNTFLSYVHSLERYIQNHCGGQ